jgi:exodeoxyribonuclease III
MASCSPRASRPRLWTSRIVGCRVAGFSIYAVHFALGEDKAGLYRLIEERSAAWTREPSLLIGDFNTGRHHVDEDGATFHLSDRFEGRQPGLGWTDMWRRFHGDRREASWISPRGNGFRIDHVLASARAVPNVAGVAYDHATRPTLTDRSATIVRYRARG